MFVCPRCGNKEEKYIGFRNGEPYCRKCIIFSGEEAKDYEHPPKKAPLSLAYKLSEEQSNLSRKIVENFVNGIDTLVYAVCGSGKTEISYGNDNFPLNEINVLNLLHNVNNPYIIHFVRNVKCKH